jgi:hypothetical protein
LSFGQSLVLLADVFEELDCLNKMLWDSLGLLDWLVPAVDEVLLSKLEKEVSTQADVEVNVAGVSLCLCNV